MKKNNLVSRPDVLMVFQEKNLVELSIKQINELSLKFKPYKMDPKNLSTIKDMKAKVLLISSNDVKHSIQFYIDYLEENEQHIAPHRAILLINNRETSCAYLACESGLFDDYCIINPLNEPFRLKLVLLQQLKMINNHKSDGLEELTAKGDDELASCIEHGVTLKKAFIDQVSLCKENILDQTNQSNVLNNKKMKEMLEKIIDLSLGKLNDNLSSNVDEVIEQLLELKENNQAMKDEIEIQRSENIKSTTGINTALLLDENNSENKSQNSNFKILIAESNASLGTALKDIFTSTLFECLVVNDGKIALAALKKFKPDVILTAYDLPSINGFEFSKLIRKQKNHVPIVAYTSEDNVGVINKWITLGLSGYLVKPLKKSFLLKTINIAINNPAKIMENKSEAGGEEIKWLPEYSVGNQDMDEQHKILFDMINEFFQQDGKQAAIAIFENLSSYIDLHFDAEESLLKQINYPQTAEHIKDHDDLRVKFTLLLNKLEDYNTEVHHKIALFLYNWLASHILSGDMDYKKYALSIEEPSFLAADI